MNNEQNQQDPLLLPAPKSHALVYGAAVIGGIAIACILVFSFSLFNKDTRASHTDTQATIASSSDTTTAQNVFADINIIAQAAYVKDLKTDTVLFTKNETRVLPLASVTKLVTAAVTSRHAHDARQEYVTISTSALATDGDSGLIAGERFKVQDALDIMLVESSNDIATALAEYVAEDIDSTTLSPVSDFVQRMNTFASSIGLVSTSFKNPTGLDESITEAGASGSAKDMAMLLEYILNNHPNILAATTKSSLTVQSDIQTHNVKNTNKVVDNVPNIVGSKTGYTELAGGNLAIIFDPGLNHPIAIVVLGSTFDGRFNDVQILASTTLSYLQSQSIENTLY